MSDLARFEQLEGDIGGQRARVGELEQARHKRPREFEAARARRLAAIREREAGGLPTDLALGHGVEGVPTDVIVVESYSDAPEMTDVERAAMVGLSPRVVTRPMGPGVSDVQIEWVDQEAEERLAGAQEALQAAVDRHREFAASHFEDLQVERATKAAAARDALIDADRIYRLAAQTYEAELVWQRKVLTAGGREDWLDQLPINPAAWSAEAPRTIPVPMPSSLTEPEGAMA